MPRPSIHLWVPSLKEGSGGIQAFSRAYVRAIAQGFPDHAVTVLVRNDCPGPDDPLRAFSHLTFFSPKGRGKLRSLAFYLDGLRFAWRERPTCLVALHLQFMPAMLLARKLSHAKILTFLYGIDVWHLKSRLERFALKRADHLMAISHFTRAVSLKQFDCAPETISIVPCTYEQDLFEPGPKPDFLLARHQLSPHQPVLLTVGRLLPAEQLKGHRQVLFALDRLRTRHPDLRYVIVGDGPDLEGLKEAVTALSLEAHVIFAGHIPQAELPAYYRLADVFVMPSIKEGFGIVFLEAMASGRPAVGGNRDGSFDALDEGQLGALVDPFDANDLAQTLSQVLTRCHSNPRLNEPSQLPAAVLARFGFDRVAHEMVEALRPWTRPQTPEALSVPSRPPPTHLPPAQGGAFRVVVVTEYTSPYQIEFFNAIARSGACLLEVVYVTDQDASRSWERLPMAHVRWILSQGKAIEWEASKSIHDADLVVFGTYLNPFVRAQLGSRAASGKPWVFWGERPGSLNTGWAGRVLRRWLLRPLRRSQAPIWGIGRFGVEGYQREFGTQRPYVNLSYASDLRRFTDLPLRDPAQRVFFFSGSLTPRKGVDLLAAAFANLAERHPQARLVIAGQGPLETTMRATLSGCAGQVEWLGFVPWDQMPEALAKGSILCLPSRYDGWGLALVEGLAAGLPAISTDQTGSAIELLQAGETGWRVPAGEMAALEQAMEAALELPNDAFAARQQAARAAAQHHGLDASVPRFLEACRAALAPV